MSNQPTELKTMAPFWGEDLTPFKRAYSRALTFVCARHYPMPSWKEGDDPFFSSGIGPETNCCAVDVLIEQCQLLTERVRQLEDTFLPPRKGSGRHTKTD